MAEGKLQWHPAFSAALRIELGEELDDLYIEEEHTLGRKPMQVDVIVIKKKKDIPIRKNIGKIFLKYNIIEYKAPNDYLSVNDFYKVYGYTCFYQSDTRKVNEIDPRQLTITYICNHYPHEMIMHLHAVRGMEIKKEEEGIYYLLRDDLKAGSEIRELLRRYENKKNEAFYPELMNLIVRANWEQMKEEKKMCEALRELFADELRESKENGIREGLERGMEKGIEKGMEKGETRGINLTKTIFKMSAQGVDIEKIAAECGISVERVMKILE